MAVGSLERNVLPGARKFVELGVRGDKPIEDLTEIEVSVRLVRRTGAAARAARRALSGSRMACP